MDRAMDKEPVIEIRPVSELQNLIELVRGQGAALALLVLGQSGVQERVLGDKLPTLRLVKGAPQHLVNVVNG